VEQWYGVDDQAVAQPPIERTAEHLRRLSARLTEGEHGDRRGRTGLRFVAAQRAYDHHLCSACQAFAVEEHLEELVGWDRAIERARLEGELERLGLVLRYRTSPSERAGSS